MNCALKRFLQFQQNKKFKKSYKVVGVTFQGRQQIIKQLYKRHSNKEEIECELVLQSDNKFDRNAISVNVFHNGDFYKIGFISKEEKDELKKDFEKIEKTEINKISYYQERNVYCVVINVCFEKEN